MAHVRSVIQTNKLVSPLFNVKQYTATQEDMYRRIHALRVAGEDLRDLLLYPEDEDWNVEESRLTFEKLTAKFDPSYYVTNEPQQADALVNSPNPQHEQDSDQEFFDPTQCLELVLDDPDNGASNDGEEQRIQFPEPTRTIAPMLQSPPPTESGPAASPDDDLVIRSPQHKRPRTLQIHRNLNGQFNDVMTPTPSVEYLQLHQPPPAPSSSSSSTAISIPRQSEQYDLKNLGKLKNVVSPGEHFFRVKPIFWIKPQDHDLNTTCTGPDHFFHGQRAVNAIYFENAANDVLGAMTCKENFKDLCFTQLQGNQFSTLFQGIFHIYLCVLYSTLIYIIFMLHISEYFFDDGVPQVPRTRNECPNFYKDPRGIMFDEPHQYAWSHSFYNKVGWTSMEPGFGNLKNMSEMKRDPELRPTSQECRLCSKLDEVNSKIKPPSCEHLYTDHCKKKHLRFQSYTPVRCPKCWRDMTHFSDEAQFKHLANHSQKPPCNESYGEEENSNDFPKYKVNLFGKVKEILSYFFA